MTKKKRLGEIVVDKGLVRQDQVNEALRAQVGGNRRLGYLLIKMGVLDGDQLLEALSDQLDMPIVSVQEKLSSEAGRILPRYLCRKYNAIPLCLEDNNVFSLAMVDPLDEEAIMDIENFTGKVVRPALAKQQDISAAVKELPFSWQNIMNPQVYNRLAKVATVVVMVLLLVAGFLVYQSVHIEKYGTISTVENKKLFKNHDLIIGVDAVGAISIFGHGAYATGYFSVTFEDVAAFETFIAQRRKSFSEKQYDWIGWVLSRKDLQSQAL